MAGFTGSVSDRLLICRPSAPLLSGRRPGEIVVSEIESLALAAECRP